MNLCFRVTQVMEYHIVFHAQINTNSIKMSVIISIPILLGRIFLNSVGDDFKSPYIKNIEKSLWKHQQEIFVPGNNSDYTGHLSIITL